MAVIRQFPPAGNFRDGKRESICESCARGEPCARDSHYERKIFKDLHCSQQLGTCWGEPANRRYSAGAGGAVAGSTATAGVVARGAAAGTKRASEAADLDPGSVEAQSR